MRPELIVAGKEFRDHLSSKRFLAIFTILMLLSIVGMVTSMDQFNKTLDNYKKYQAESQQQPGFKEQVASLQKQIADREAKGGSAAEVQALRQQLDMMVNPPMPSVLSVFGGMNDGSGLGGGFFSIILMLLSMALGFDLITREKEEGSLKSLLSHPVYRDAVINGKMIGAMSILVVVMGSVFLVTVAIMMFYGAVPTVDDLSRLGAYFVMAVLYSGIFFAIATLFSTISRTSTMSILCILFVMVALVILPTFVPNIASAIMGPAPEISTATFANNSTYGTNNGNIKPVQFDTAAQEYYYNRWKLTDTMDTISPIYDFGTRISAAILYKQSASTGPSPSSWASMKPRTYTVPTLLESLEYVWINILAMIIELAVPIAVTYVMFMRTDVQ